MIKNEAPILLDDESERYNPNGCMPARDLSGLVIELSNGEYEVMF